MNKFKFLQMVKVLPGDRLRLYGEGTVGFISEISDGTYGLYVYNPMDMAIVNEAYWYDEDDLEAINPFADGHPIDITGLVTDWMTRDGLEEEEEEED